ncbi:MAG: PadR family transcriptional regulator [Acidobacteriota bacterium]
MPRPTPSSDSNLMRGSLELLILKSLCWGSRHGYDVSEWIEQATGTAILVEEGTLYPALHRLEKRGWIEAEWGLSKNRRRAKFYRLTGAGRTRLHDDARAWRRHAEGMAKALAWTQPETAR